MSQPLTLEALKHHIDQRFRETDDLITAFKDHADERFDELTRPVGEVKQRLAGVEYRLDRFETRLDRFEDRTEDKFTVVAKKMGLKRLTP